MLIQTESKGAAYIISYTHFFLKSDFYEVLRFVFVYKDGNDGDVKIHFMTSMFS